MKGNQCPVTYQNFSQEQGGGGGGGAEASQVEQVDKVLPRSIWTIKCQG